MDRCRDLGRATSEKGAAVSDDLYVHSATQTCHCCDRLARERDVERLARVWYAVSYRVRKFLVRIAHGEENVSELPLAGHSVMGVV